MLIEDDTDDDVLMPAERPADTNAVAFANETVGFGVLSVDLDFAALTCAFGLGARLEEAGYIQPDVQSNIVVHD